MLSELKNTSRIVKKGRRIGRGTGCKHGKTCGRGHKGHGARSGYYRQFGYEGGQVKLFMKLPIRGFSRGKFIENVYALNLELIEKMFNNGETVSLATLKEKGIIGNNKWSYLKILGNGELTKKVKIEAHLISEGALKQLESKKVEFKKLG